MTDQDRGDSVRRIKFEVAIDAFSIEACVQALREKGILIDLDADQIVNMISGNIPSQILKLEVIKAEEFPDEARQTAHIREEARRSGLISPPKYLALHVLSHFHRFRFGCGFIVFPHYPVTVTADGKRARKRILAIRYKRGRLALSAPREDSEFGWDKNREFVFVRPK